MNEQESFRLRLKYHHPHNQYQEALLILTRLMIGIPLLLTPCALFHSTPAPHYSITTTLTTSAIPAGWPPTGNLEPIRHLAIMYPLRKKGSLKFRKWQMRKTHVIITIWSLGFAISLPEYLMFNAEPFCYNNRLYYECKQIWPGNISNQYTIL